MKKRIILMSFLLGFIFLKKGFSQDDRLSSIDYKIIAEGTDSPFPELQIVCYNKYFNKDYLPTDFRKKYNLDEKTLYKKKMLVEIFHSDKNKKGLDKIDLVNIKENHSELLIEYNILNSDSSNDDKQFSPFMIIQLPKSKKEIRFIANGVELGKVKDVYVD